MKSAFWSSSPSMERVGVRLEHDSRRSKYSENIVKKFYPEDIKATEALKERSWQMRREPTYCEKIIWNVVRNNRLGVKFRRQFIISYYIVDFICIERKLIIEIDGASHYGNEEHDRKRESELVELGFTVLRFTDEEVVGNGNKVVDKILAVLGH